MRHIMMIIWRNEGGEKDETVRSTTRIHHLLLPTFQEHLLSVTKNHVRMVDMQHRFGQDRLESLRGLLAQTIIPRIIIARIQEANMRVRAEEGVKAKRWTGPAARIELRTEEEANHGRAQSRKRKHNDAESGHRTGLLYRG
jgi:hypothetical protein